MPERSQFLSQLQLRQLIIGKKPPPEAEFRGDAAEVSAVDAALLVIWRAVLGLSLHVPYLLNLRENLRPKDLRRTLRLHRGKKSR